MSIRHVILDRDGTLIRHIPYLADPAQVELLPTVAEGLKKLADAGCTLYLHTNQSGVGRGLFTLDDVMACNNAMMEKIGLGKRVFRDICIAPEHPDDPPHTRKPSPTWGLEVMAKMNVDKTALCYIGDSATDMLTAKNIGCTGLGVNTGLDNLHQQLAKVNIVQEFLVFDQFIDAAGYVLTH